MSRPIFSVDVQLEAIPVATMPANAEMLARLYVGDFAYGLLRDPRNRALFLAGVDGYFRLDVPQLLASFADALREWQRQIGWLDGIVSSGPLSARASARTRLPRDLAAQRRTRDGNRPAAAASRRLRPLRSARATRRATRKGGTSGEGD